MDLQILFTAGIFLLAFLSLLVVSFNHMLKPLNFRVKRLEEGQAKLEKGQAKLEKSVVNLEKSVVNLEEGQAEILRKIDNLSPPSP